MNNESITFYRSSAKILAYGILFLFFSCIIFCITQFISTKPIGTEQLKRTRQTSYNVPTAVGNTITVYDAVVVWNPSNEVESERIEYIKLFAKVAVAEHKRFGIPASISLAQGILESGNGESTLAKKAKNHFGMKCFSHRCKRGHCINFKDDSHKDFFLKFRTAWESWRAHSKLLVGKKYKHLIGRDYSSYAAGLQAAGYATSKTYSADLIRIIEECDLGKFDGI
jgi:flagellum-specific peptidoglycan hydrolase FlgJ